MSGWTRRDWVTTNVAAMIAAQRASSQPAPRWRPAGRGQVCTSEAAERGRLLIDASTWESIAQKGVEAALTAGASYADAHLTRTVNHLYTFAHPNTGSYFSGDTEVNGAGVRVLVNGYWGFASAPDIDTDSLTQLAQTAVAQAKVNALGSTRVAVLAPCHAVKGSWVTPMKIDPFSISIEEKNDYITSWIEHSNRTSTPIVRNWSGIHFTRQERVLATSEGTLTKQRIYESGGSIICTDSIMGDQYPLTGIQQEGRGWEKFTERAKIIDQLTHMGERVRAAQLLSARAKPLIVGLYTVVCDGQTMASILDQTLGLATQLDRALGYEANASGTSYLNNPLEMLGTQITAPMVTVTTNRNAEGQLATVRWDAEGVVPSDVTLVKDGKLNDFQTTREQATWLAPYYSKIGRPVQSGGCAMAESALEFPIQQMPNLAMAPAGAVSRDDLIANVSNGVLLTGGTATSDFQAKNGMIQGTFQKIVNGRLGPQLSGGAVQFNTQELWKNVTAVAGLETVGSFASSAYPDGSLYGIYGITVNLKGQPAQITSHTTTAPAATISKLAIIDPMRKA